MFTRFKMPCVQFVILATIAFVAQAGDAYEAYVRSLEKRHEAFHKDAEASLWGDRLQNLAEKHSVSDGQPAAAFPETYWRELVAQIAAMGSRHPEKDAQELMMEAEAQEDGSSESAAINALAAEPNQMNFINGEHKVSGGAGEGSQKLGPLGQFNNMKESKSDQLPSYCHPPNPCPTGFNPDSFGSPCEKNVLDTMQFNKDYIWNKMASGECTCDSEHMNKCPRSSQSTQNNDLSSILNNPFLSGEKRRVVAKKIPHNAMYNDASLSQNMVKRNAKFQSKIKAVENPWLQGEILREVQKKAGPNANHLDMM